MDETAREKNIRLRRLAAQIVCLLPEDAAEARAALGYAGELLESFVFKEPADATGDEPAPAENVSLFRRVRPLVLALGLICGTGVVHAAIDVAGLCPLHFGQSLRKLAREARPLAGVNPVQMDACSGTQLARCT